MKYLSLLIVFTVIFSAGSAYAQSSSKLNGKSYTYVMKKIDGTGPEIIDKITFSGNSVTSEQNSAAGYKPGSVIEKGTSANSAQFELTFAGTEGTMKYSGNVTDALIDGTILVTDKNGVQSTMAVRGMLTEEWDNIQRIKKEAKEKEKKAK